MLIRLSRFGYLALIKNEVILHYRRHRSNMGAALGIERQAWLVRPRGSLLRRTIACNSAPPAEAGAPTSNT